MAADITHPGLIASLGCRSKDRIETRDVKRSESAREELLAGGGDLKVPCLRIEDEHGQSQWMYESKDIINYLESRFDPVAPTTAAT